MVKDLLRLLAWWRALRLWRRGWCEVFVAQSETDRLMLHLYEHLLAEAGIPSAFTRSRPVGGRLWVPANRFVAATAIMLRAGVRPRLEEAAGEARKEQADLPVEDVWIEEAERMLERGELPLRKPPGPAA